MNPQDLDPDKIMSAANYPLGKPMTTPKLPNIDMDTQKSSQADHG